MSADLTYFIKDGSVLTKVPYSGINSFFL